jgi:hypothetical protein
MKEHLLDYRQELEYITSAKILEDYNQWIQLDFLYKIYYRCSL